MDKWKKMANDAWEVIIKDVRALWNGGKGFTQDAIAKKLGLSQRGVVNMWLSGQRKATNASLPALFRYLEALGHDPLDFFPGKQPMMHRPTPQAPMEEVKGKNLQSVPLMGETGAGAPEELFTGSSDSLIQILPQYYRADMIALYVRGDSMEPTIKNGAIVGIASLTEDITEGGIYLVSVPCFGRVVKRLKLSEDGKLLLCSDNPKYKPYPVDPAEQERTVLGQVVWVLQMV